MAKGGIFLADQKHFIRLKNDSSQIVAVKNKKDFYRIRKNVAYMYWENNKDLDTLFCTSNVDTLSMYKWVYTISESKSNIQTSSFEGGAIKMVLNSLYYSLLFPLFLNAKGIIQILASFENLLLIISFIIVLIGFIQNKKKAFFPFFLIFICLMLCFLVGLATPNSGAIFRYRSPVIAFIFLAALYYFPSQSFKNRRRHN